MRSSRVFPGRLALLLSLGLAMAANACRNGDAPATPIEYDVQAAALTVALTAQDIGAITPAGTYSQSAGTHTIEGAGADIWNAADAFRFAQQSLTGDGTITARLVSLENTDPFAKAGLMMRESSAAGAKNVMAVVTPTSANGFRFQSRTATNATTAKLTAGAGAPPSWLRLTRTGNSFTAFSSPNGTTWTAIGTAISFTMNNTIMVGLAVTSHLDGTLATAIFDNVTITTPAPPAPPSAPTGLVATAGNTQVGLTWTASAGATSYSVKGGTSMGGPYSPIQSGITATNFTHAGLSNGTTYYYVVSASNANGESANSGEVNAKPVPPPAPAAPTGLVATAGNTQVALSWTASSGATSYAVKGSTAPGGPYAVIQPSTTATNFTHTGLVNGTTYYYVVSASNAGGESANSGQAQAVPTAPPPPTFASQEIGAATGGSWSESAGTHTIKGAGADMYGTADAFRFAYQTVTGDVTITARVQSFSGPHTFSKASVVIRDDLTAGARNVATLLSPTSTNKYRQQQRSTTGGTTTSVSSVAASAIPSYLKLERVGSTFKSFHSTNGTSWTQIGTTITQAMNATVKVGLGVSSHVVGSLATAVFTNVVITTPAPPAAPTDLTATPGNNQVHLTWTAPADATSYTLKRAASSGGTYATVQSGIATTQFTNTGLVNGTTYYFVVTATNPAGSSGNSAEVPGTPVLLHPSVRSISPVDGATGVDPAGFVSGDLIMPNVGGGVDAATLTNTTVMLRRASDSALVPATLNTSGGGDVVVLQPTTALNPHTQYNFTITAGLQDLTGASFVPFSSSFTTGDADPPPPADIKFDQVALPTTAGHVYTSVTIGPDNKLYAATLGGELLRWSMNADGTLGAATVINTIINNNGGARAVIGLTFDPAATSSNLILWVTHGGSALKEAPDWSGKLSKLSGASLGTYQDVLVNFPRSYKDHMTNSIAFRPGEPNMVYIVQGSMNAMGAPDNAWGQRSEHLLSATILRLDTTKLPGTLPLDIKTNDADPTASLYNPFAANAPLIIYASGVRNAYDLIWHSNGQLYSATNGSAAGGSTPASVSPLPSACSRRMDGTPYTGPQVSGIAGNPIAEDDFLYRVVQNGYYGHPNPSRCEWVLNGGNPTSGTDVGEVTGYPVGTQPDRNWRGAAYTFGAHYSPNGTIEWKSDVFASMKGKLLIIRFSGGDDIIVLTLDPTTKNVASVQTGITGFGGFADPLDLVANPATGHIYVTEHAADKITLLRPHP
jgi:fibronectin type 3 domain-containing protein